MFIRNQITNFIALMNFCHIDFHHFEWIPSDDLSWLQQIFIKKNKFHHSDEFQLHLWALLNWSIFSRVRTFHQTLQGWIFITLMNFHHNNEVSSKYFHYSDELSSHRLVFITYFIIHQSDKSETQCSSSQSIFNRRASFLKIEESLSQW